MERKIKNRIKQIIFSVKIFQIKYYQNESHNYIDTYYANEKLTNNLPHLTKYVCRHLDKEGLVKIGSYVNA